MTCPLPREDFRLPLSLIETMEQLLADEALDDDALCKAVRRAVRRAMDGGWRPGKALRDNLSTLTTEALQPEVSKTAGWRRAMFAVLINTGGRSRTRAELARMARLTEDEFNAALALHRLRLLLMGLADEKVAHG